MKQALSSANMHRRVGLANFYWRIWCAHSCALRRFQMFRLFISNNLQTKKLCSVFSTDVRRRQWKRLGPVAPLIYISYHCGAFGAVNKYTLPQDKPTAWGWGEKRNKRVWKISRSGCTADAKLFSHSSPYYQMKCAKHAVLNPDRYDAPLFPSQLRIHIWTKWGKRGVKYTMKPFFLADTVSPPLK